MAHKGKTLACILLSALALGACGEDKIGEGDDAKSSSLPIPLLEKTRKPLTETEKAAMREKAKAILEPIMSFKEGDTPPSEQQIAEAKRHFQRNGDLAGYELGEVLKRITELEHRRQDE